MDKKDVICALSFMFLLGGALPAHADTTLNPVKNLKKIEENSKKEQKRWDEYKKATTPKENPKPSAQKTK